MWSGRRPCPIEHSQLALLCSKAAAAAAAAAAIQSAHGLALLPWLCAVIL